MLGLHFLEQQHNSKEAVSKNIGLIWYSAEFLGEYAIYGT